MNPACGANAADWDGKCGKPGVDFIHKRDDIGEKCWLCAEHWDKLQWQKNTGLVRLGPGWVIHE